MANYEAATITTENKWVFDKLGDYFLDELNHFGFCDKKDNKIALRNRHGFTLDAVINLSNVYNDVPITLTLAFEHTRYERKYTLVVVNGAYEVIDCTEKSD